MTQPLACIENISTENISTKGNDPAFDGLTPWPEERINAYCERGYWQQQNLAQWLQHTLSRDKEKVVLTGLDSNGKTQDLTGDELLLHVKQLAQGLANLGLQAGDKAVLQFGNTNAFVLTLFALFELGVIPVMALPGHRHKEIKHFLQLTEAKAWLVGAMDDLTSFLKMAQQLQTEVTSLKHIIFDTQTTTPFLPLSSVFEPSVTIDTPLFSGQKADPSGIALLLCSGGTTGIPKLIPRTHRDYLFNAKASAEVCELTAEDGYLVLLPAAHNFPLACPGMLGALEQGARIIMCPSPSPDIAYEWIEKNNATVTALVPPLVRVWLQSAELGFLPPDTLRMLQVGGSRLDPDLAKKVPKELGCQLQQVFGMAEGLLNFTRASDLAMLVQKTQGRPLAELDEIRIVDHQGKEVATGQKGELWTRGPYTLRGYYKDEAANKKSFSADGYYQTGDLVRQLSSGHLIVEGRIKDVIRRGAETIPAESLETDLERHTDIKSAAVIGLPCQRLGQQVCAVLVLKNNAQAQPTLSDIRHFLLEEGLAHFMLPDAIEYINELPMTAVGKVAYQQLIAKFTSPSLTLPSKALPSKTLPSKALQSKASQPTKSITTTKKEARL